MARYLRDHARSIRIDKGQNVKPRPLTDLAKPGEVTGSRASLGSRLWCTRKACPQAAGDVCILASTVPIPSVKDMQEMNATLRRLQQSVDVPIKVRPIPLSRLTGLVFTDASFGNAEGNKLQLAYLACCADVSIQGRRSRHFHIMLEESQDVSGSFQCSVYGSQRHE